MYYLGLRSTHVYLDRLTDVASHEPPHHLTSVIGGLAFLHALSPRTESLTLVDVDPDSIKHLHLIRKLVGSAETLDDFFGFLFSARREGASFDAGAPYARTNGARSLRSILSAEEMDTYEETYGRLSFDTAAACARGGEWTVLVSGFDLRHFTYSWHFGMYNLRSEETFQIMKLAIASVPIEIRLQSLQDVDFDRCGGASLPHIVLASNAESPLFTRGDVIFGNAVRSCRRPTRYVSWIRDTRLPAGNDDAALLRAAVLPRHGWLLALDDGEPADLPGEVNSWTRIGKVKGLQGICEYGQSMLYVCGGGAEDLDAILMEAAPMFRQVLWRPSISVAGYHPSSDAAIRYSGPKAAESGAYLFTLRGLPTRIRAD